ncbi:MAG TPA: hypothetical protein VHL98_16530 [Microvirga sp.]|jgi:hypothetical protein|nr:hypothetical protein [Microvirga sp.]
MWSRNRARSLKVLAAALAASSVAGCADYLNHHDTVTLRAGDAQNWNKTVQTTDPWPPYVKNTDIDGDGQRTMIGVRNYSEGTTPLASGGGTGGAGGTGAAAAQ